MCFLVPDISQLLKVLVVTILTELVVHEPLGILPFAVLVVLEAAVADHVREDAEEGELFLVAGEALVFGVVQLAGAVVVEDVPENVRVAVEEVLLRVLVVEELALVRAEQRVRVLFQRVPPRLEPPAGHIYQQLLIFRLASILTTDKHANVPN